MNKEIIAGIVVSALIFAFPRKFPVRLYTKIRKFFKGKSKATDTPSYTYDPHLTPEEAQIEELFRRACKVVQNASSLSDQQQLTLYGLYKQALFGDCDKPKPKASDLIELKKWEAWYEQKGRTNKGAKEEYVRTVEKFVPSAKIREGDFKANGGQGDDDDVFMTDEEYKRMKQEDKKKSLGMMFSRPVEEENVAALPEEADIESFFKLIDAEDLEKIKQAIKNGFDLYKDSSAGMKAIHYAIENEKESVVELLCEHYTDLNVPDETGLTPLHYAVAHEDEGIIEILLSKDVDISKPDHEGETAYELASARIKKFINAHKKEGENSE